MAGTLATAGTQIAVACTQLTVVVLALVGGDRPRCTSGLVISERQARARDAGAEFSKALSWEYADTRVSASDT